jgi:hypothetical protein
MRSPERSQGDKLTVAKSRRWQAVYWIVLALILADCAVADFGAEPNWTAKFCSVRPAR